MAIPNSTNSATKFWTGVVSDFGSTKGMAIDIATVEEDFLANHLQLEDFYLSLKKKDGTVKAGQLPGCTRGCSAGIEPPQSPNACSLPGTWSGKQPPRHNSEGEEVGGSRGSCHPQRERARVGHWLGETEGLLFRRFDDVGHQETDFLCLVLHNSPALVNAIGPHLNNVTINVQAPQAEKRNWRLSLKLKKKKKPQVEPNKTSQTLGTFRMWSTFYLLLNISRCQLTLC